MFDLDAYGGRKFVLSMVVILLGTFLVWFGKIDQEIYKYLILVTASAYITGNVTQKTLVKEEPKNGVTS